MTRFLDLLRTLFGGRADVHPVSAPAVPVRVPTRSPFAAGNNAFAIALYHQLGRQRGNLLFSPLSIRAALAMAYAGARQQTAAEMRAALRFPPTDEDPHLGFKELLDRLGRDAGVEYALHVANSLWAQEGEPLLAPFVEVVARSYDGGVRLVDFLRAAEAVRSVINQWVEDHTQRRITNLIPVGQLSPDTRLVLVNAVYFKGKWSLSFPVEDTRDEPFYRSRGGAVRASLMHQCERFDYMRGRTYQAVDLLYRGGDLSMLVLLPDRKDGLPDLESVVSERMLEECVAQMQERVVNLYLPRFTMTWGTQAINQGLEALGMVRAFQDRAADFSGINGIEPPDGRSLYLSLVLHKAFVAVNEEGTEAAAATAVEISLAAMPVIRPEPIPVFRADHPFLFAVRHRRSGAILFLGRVEEPAQSSSLR